VKYNNGIGCLVLPECGFRPSRAGTQQRAIAVHQVSFAKGSAIEMQFQSTPQRHPRLEGTDRNHLVTLAAQGENEVLWRAGPKSHLIGIMHAGKDDKSHLFSLRGHPSSVRS
jgi:hypothetical protein